MTGRRVSLAIAATASMALGGCASQGGGHSAPALDSLPLVTGATVVARARSCDKGANAYCSDDLVVVAPSYGTSSALIKTESAELAKLGWTTAYGDTGNQQAAESPGHKLRVTYATASGDLVGYDLGWIKRPRKIALAMVKTVFDRSPAMSLMLESGPQ